MDCQFELKLLDFLRFTRASAARTWRTRFVRRCQKMRIVSTIYKRIQFIVHYSQLLQYVGQLVHACKQTHLKLLHFKRNPIWYPLQLRNRTISGSHSFENITLISNVYTLLTPDNNCTHNCRTAGPEVRHANTS